MAYYAIRNRPKITKLAVSIDKLGQALKANLHKDYDASMSLISKMREKVQILFT